MSEPEAHARVTFADCVLACLNNRELLASLDRLRGTNLSRRGSPIELAIDEATGRAEADVAVFLEFVKDVVWDRLPPEVREPDRLR
jgi:hypothetical protein